MRTISCGTTTLLPRPALPNSTKFQIIFSSSSHCTSSLKKMRAALASPSSTMFSSPRPLLLLLNSPTPPTPPPHCFIATNSLINTAYRMLARSNQQHVNNEPGAEENFKAISNAYEVLSDDEKRPVYGEAGLKKGAGMGTGALVVGTIALLSTFLLTVIHPIIAPPAFATFQTATKAAGAPLRTELLTSAWTGFFAGCLHTLSGPDHLAALAPLSIGRTPMESAAVGALWGCGHDAGQVIFGLLFLVLKDRLHIEIIRTWGTRVVGLTLLVIGAMGIKEAREAATTPCVVLENGECDVSSTYESMDNPTMGKKKKIGFATFATGVVHGLQPDALMMVLPALALPSRVAGAAFLGMFLVGTVISMGSYTVFIGSCSQALKERVPRITEKLTWASSLIAIAFGLAIIVSQYFGFNLY